MRVPVHVTVSVGEGVAEAVAMEPVGMTGTAVSVAVLPKAETAPEKMASMMSVRSVPELPS